MKEPLTRTRVLYARIDSDVYERLHRMAEETGQSLARVTERVLMRGLRLPDRVDALLDQEK